jgi:hypothetical protein
MRTHVCTSTHNIHTNTCTSAQAHTHRHKIHTKYTHSPDSPPNPPPNPITEACYTPSCIGSPTYTPASPPPQPPAPAGPGLIAGGPGRAGAGSMPGVNVCVCVYICVHYCGTKTAKMTLDLVLIIRVSWGPGMAFCSSAVSYYSNTLNVHSREAAHLGLARTIYIWCIYGIFGREITKYTVKCGVYIRFWPTLRASVGQECIVKQSCARQRREEI